jgi:hypothetical protein
MPGAINRRAVAALAVTGARMQKNSAGLLLGVVACLAALMPTNAYAYLDPGTGTFALQGLIAGVAGGLVAVRAYWRQIGSAFRRSKTSSEISSEGSLRDDDA